MRIERTIPVEFNLIEHQKSKMTFLKVILVIMLVGLLLILSGTFYQKEFEIFLFIGIITMFISMFLIFIFGLYRLLYYKDFKKLNDSFQIHNDRIDFKTNQLNRVLKVKEINDLKFKYGGIDKRFSSDFGELKRARGDFNYISFKYNEQAYNFEFYIGNDRQDILLRRILLFWKERNINYEIITAGNSGS